MRDINWEKSLLKTGLSRYLIRHVLRTQTNDKIMIDFFIRKLAFSLILAHSSRRRMAQSRKWDDICTQPRTPKDIPNKLCACRTFTFFLFHHPAAAQQTSLLNRREARHDEQKKNGKSRWWNKTFSGTVRFHFPLQRIFFCVYLFSFIPSWWLLSGRLLFVPDK